MPRPSQQPSIVDVDEWTAPRRGSRSAGLMEKEREKVTPVLSLETRVEIDLTKERQFVDLTLDDDSSEPDVVFTGMKTNGNSKEVHVERRQRHEYGGRSDSEPPRKKLRTLATQRRREPVQNACTELDSYLDSELSPYDDDSMRVNSRTPEFEYDSKASAARVPAFQSPAASLQSTQILASQYSTSPTPRHSTSFTSPYSTSPTVEFEPEPVPKLEWEPSPQLDIDVDSDEYECIHAGFDVKDESLWKAPKQNPARFENDVIETIEDWTLSSDAVKEKRRLRTSRTSTLASPPRGEFVWDLLRQVRKPTAANRYGSKPTILKGGPRYSRMHSQNGMHVQASFKVAPGSINRLEQHCGWVAIASSCLGGQADEPNEEPNPYNRTGSLLTWNGQYNILSGHFSKKEYGEKHYTINDVKFDPTGNCFVSAGMDKKVRVWRRPQGSKTYSGGYDLDVYGSVPHELAFRPGNAILAVGVKDVHVYSNLEPTARRSRMNLVLTADTRHSTGAIKWDTNRPHILYASSEPQDDDLIGVHKAFDVTKSTEILTFDAAEAGDAMATAEGVLALATRGADGNYMRLFDIASKNPDAMQKIVLEPFPRDAPAREISCITFSPDGIYLALARTDNSVHVYDSRMLKKGVLHKYQHDYAHFVCPGSSLFGVTQAQWIAARTGQHALLSGGEDGCVRLWNPMWSNAEPSNGRTIAEVNSDIGFFSLGDPYQGEYDLVVGDSSGEVTIFSGLLNHL